MAPSKTRLHPHKSLLQLALILTPLLIGLPWLSLHLHYKLPTPLVELYNNVTGAPQLSEYRMVADARFLSENIGYRTVGTREHAIGDTWMKDKLVEMKILCDDAIARKPDRALECEIWRQEGSGKHRFDMMNHRVYKAYHGLTNHIMRISAGTDASKEHSVLVNSHVDSTLPSPGAADDAICVGVMLEVIRVLVETDVWEPSHSIVFLFNNAEESLQDASHLFSTQHELAETARAVINLEAAGTTGPELLFQATSEEMIKAYSHVPRPHGSVLANDVFNSGVILSDTDFRQFVHYRNMTGLDMAIVGNSYLYHTRKDLVENIEPGVAQHMAENVLALLLHLTASESPLPHLVVYHKPATVYFSLLSSMFFVYSYETAFLLHVALSVCSVALAILTTRDWAVTWRAWIGVLGGQLGAVAAANLVAWVMATVLGKGLSWFSREWLCVVLYGPPAVLGALVVQLLIHPAPAQPPIEHQSITTVMLFYSALATCLQYIGLGSAYMPFINSLSCFVAMGINEIINLIGGGIPGSLSSWTYAVGQFIPLLGGAEAFAGFLEIFVPLTGRLGKDAPVENIIATIVGFLTLYTLPFVIPFAHRFGRPALRTTIAILAVLITVIMALFSSPGWSPYDAMHQKRLFLAHVENVTSGEFALHVASLDTAPGMTAIVDQIANEVAATPAGQTSWLSLEEGDAAWDVIYPVSDFLKRYKLPLDQPSSYVSTWSAKFTVTAVQDTVDVATNTRSLRLVIDHPGVIWTVIGFDADVVSWDLDDHPPSGYLRHHVKEASFYGSESWFLNLVIRLPDTVSSSPNLLVNFVGVTEKGTWPGKKHDKEGPAMDMFEVLDGRINEIGGGTIDATLVGCVAGAAWV